MKILYSAFIFRAKFTQERMGPPALNPGSNQSVNKRIFFCCKRYRLINVIPFAATPTVTREINTLLIPFLGAAHCLGMADLVAPAIFIVKSSLLDMLIIFSATVTGLRFVQVTPGTL